MKKLYKILIAFTLILPLANNVSATHVAGGDLSYEYMGPNHYRLILKLFRTCQAGSSSMGTTASVSFFNSCSLSNPSPSTLNLQDPNTGTNCTGTAASCATEISQLCPTQQNNSECNGGSLPGMQMYKYIGEVTFPAGCSNWVMNFSLGNRNCSLNLSVCTGGTNGTTYDIPASINSTDFPTNSSPIFVSPPIPYVCVNQPVNYSFGVIEPDGDSLTYTLVDALQGIVDATTFTPASYNAPYSGTVPLASSLPPGPNTTTLDINTGQINFIPTTIGKWVVAVRVDEFDRVTQQHIGFVIRDIQFVVQNCTNVVPSAFAGTIFNFSGTATQTGTHSVEMCEGQDFCFNVAYHDTNSIDTLTLITNISTILPGSSFTFLPGNPDTATVCWTAPSGSALSMHSFSITANDQACPVVGLQTFSYSVYVSAATHAGPDVSVCGPIPAQLHATGGNVFTWTVLSGDAMTPTNFSCNPCADPLANPSNTTTYIVTSDLSATCINTDTVVVTIHGLPTASFSGLDTVYCPSLIPVPLHQLPTTPAGVFTGLGIVDSTFVPGLNALNDDTIRFHYTDQWGCQDSTYLITRVREFNNGVPLTSAGLLDTYCLNDLPTQLTGTPSGGTYSPAGYFAPTDIFSPNLAGAGTHYIDYIFIDSNNCPGVLHDTTTVYALPTAVIANMQDHFCNYDSPITLTANPAGGSFSPSQTIDPASLPLGPNVFHYTITDAHNCTGTTSATTNIYGLPPTSAGIDDSLCAGTCITLHASGAASYHWLPTAGLSDSTSSDPEACPEVTTAYTVTGTASVANGSCVSSSVVNAVVLPNPTDSISVAPNLLRGTKPFKVIFDARTQNATFYSWTFGDGESSTDEHPTHIFNQLGVDTVVLVVTNFNNMCHGSDTVLVLIDDSVSLESRNIFTPNGDGMNDQFMVKTDGLETIDVDIYNRWGKKVAEYHGVGNGWDGKTHAGSNAADGVYFYIARAKGLNGNYYDVSTNPDLKGFVQLLRDK